MVTQALIAMQQFDGQYAKAAATTQEAFEQAGRAKAPDVQAAALLLNAAARGLAGLCEESEAVVTQALALDKSKMTQAYAAVAAGVCGNGKQVQSLAQELSTKFPDDTLIQQVYLPLAKGFVALAAGRSQEAVANAQPVKPYDANFPGSYLQGLAHLQLHDANRAVSEFHSRYSPPEAT